MKTYGNISILYFRKLSCTNTGILYRETNVTTFESGKNRKQTVLAIYEQRRVRNYDATRSLCGALAAQQRLLGIYVNG